MGRIFERLLHQVGLMRRQGQSEIRPCLAMPGVSLRFDLHSQNVPAPAVGESLFHVPAAGSKVFNLLH
ncbi:MAG: hypothetical protein A2X46_17850 [Lentisphaerae bacterium GWF2_57_35]|nr:MAG: hypothetical protein A2X46_17850 [Lentisphaerae bacterium GWF2_57_35]